MMNVQEAIRGRRSIRRFTEQEISGGQLALIFEAVRWSPSWGNSQCWEIIVVRERGTRELLRKTLAARNPAGPAMETAPLVLVLAAARGKSGCYKGEGITKFAEWFLFDLGLASQNLCLAAHDLGLGTVIVGAFDHDRVREIVGLPEGYEAVTMIPVGHADHAPSAPGRREAAEFVHAERFRG
jgi:nitroreductase